MGDDGHARRASDGPACTRQCTHGPVGPVSGPCMSSPSPDKVSIIR